MHSVEVQIGVSEVLNSLLPNARSTITVIQPTNKTIETANKTLSRLVLFRSQCFPRLTGTELAVDVLTLTAARRSEQTSLLPLSPFLTMASTSRLKTVLHTSFIS